MKRRFLSAVPQRTRCVNANGPNSRERHTDTTKLLKFSVDNAFFVAFRQRL